MTGTSAPPGNTSPQPSPGYYQPPQAPSGYSQPPTLGGPQPRSKGAASKHRGLRTVGIILGGLLLLFIGIGVGSASNGNAGALNTANRNLNTANRNLNTANRNLAAARSQLSTVGAEYSSAKTQAQRATTVANAKARAAYAARNAALNQRSKSLDQRAKAVSAAEGMIQSSQISSDGVYVVGRDIKAGIYHTTGDGGQTDSECYFATLNSTNTSDISDNNNFDGPETVDVSGAYAFEINGPCTWVRVG